MNDMLNEDGTLNFKSEEIKNIIAKDNEAYSKYCKEMHLCNKCKKIISGECPYSDRITKASDILRKINSKSTEYIEKVLGTNPNKNCYIRSSVIAGPIIACNLFEEAINND